MKTTPQECIDNLLKIAVTPSMLVQILTQREREAHLDGLKESVDLIQDAGGDNEDYHIDFIQKRINELENENHQ